MKQKEDYKNNEPRIEDKFKEIEGTKSQSMCSVVQRDGSLVEMVYNPEEDKSLFAIYKDEKIEYQGSIKLSERRILKPIPPWNSFIKNDVVLFASGIEEYGTELQLLKEIQNHIRKYVDITPEQEMISSYYVLFSWLYDCFNEVPYLRLLGDTGSGKTRFIDTVGPLCYKPISGGGSVTSASIFRTLEKIRGTFIIDEGDFKHTNLWTDIIKILNVGFENKPGVVIRCEGERYEPRAFSVFGCKILASREPFEDSALESRCLTFYMETTAREDIPRNLPKSIDEEARHLRNKLLLWRFRNYGEFEIKPEDRIPSIQPRLDQIVQPLLTVVKDEKAKNQIKDFIKRYNQRLVSNRGMDFEAEVLEEILRILKEGKPPIIQNIALAMNEKYGFTKEDEKYITPRNIGYTIRRKLRLQPIRTKKGYEIPPDEIKKAEKLALKYGIEKDKITPRESGEEEKDDSINKGLY